jgi:thiamine biosynthesis lipoprotein
VTRLAFRAMGCDAVAVDAPDAPEVLERYEHAFSRFRPDSELSRVNRRGGGRVSALFAEVLGTALWAAEETGGLVDPTVGAAVAAAGYDRDFGEGLDRAEPARAARVPGWRRVRLRGCALVLPRGCVLDLNGVVKALAVDEAASGGGCVAVGGDVASRSPVDVALPGGDAVSVAGGIATSGTGARAWLRAGVRQHHLVDPATARPARSRWAVVTVVGATCLAADVAAKAALLLGDDGPAWLEARGLPGRFLDAAGSVVTTSQWAGALEPACT